jgi:saccharopine dehydrogenase-like NADP-dependent oxidoreductase
MKVKILGGAGAVGKGVVKDLLKNPAVEKAVIADISAEAARAAIAELRDPRLSFERVDANSHASLAAVMDKEFVIANCIGPHYKYCRPIVEAAVSASVRYCDICDDYDAAESVFELHEAAIAKGCVAITCLGTSPGVTNMLAKRGSELLDETEEIHTYWTVGGSDPTGPSEIFHLAHICSDTVPQFLNGKWERVPALSGTMAVEFPEPVGKIDISYIGHSEPVTLPRFIPGVKTVTNRGGLYPPSLNALIRFVRDIGLFADFKLPFRGIEIAPREYIALHFHHLLTHSPDALGLERTEPVSVFRVEVNGKKNGQKVEVIYSGTNEVVTTTARSLSIGIQALGEGVVRQTGVLAPEACLPVDLFFRQLAVGGGVTLSEEIRRCSVLLE